jgi:hypothetical protein
MSLYYNFVPTQRRVQQLVELFNKNEQLWESLETQPRLRRRLFQRLSPKVRKQLDLLDFAMACPPQDCVGWFEEP